MNAEEEQDEADGIEAPGEDVIQNGGEDRDRFAAEDVSGKAGECMPKRILSDPGQPTQSEVEDHRTEGHVRYRCWCSDCVAGRATGEQHRKRTGERRVPVFAFDYLFITKTDKVVDRKELLAGDEEIAVKILVATDSMSKSVFGHVVDKKGPGEDKYAVHILVEDLKWLGYSRVSLRSDNKKAILKLLQETMTKVFTNGMVHT